MAHQGQETATPNQHHLLSGTSALTSTPNWKQRSGVDILPSHGPNLPVQGHVTALTRVVDASTEAFQSECGAYPFAMSPTTTTSRLFHFTILIPLLKSTSKLHLPDCHKTKPNSISHVFGFLCMEMNEFPMLLTLLSHSKPRDAYGVPITRLPRYCILHLGQHNYLLSNQLVT